MFDPLSALSCIGFAIGVMGFLATTLSKINEDVGKARECTDLLFHFDLQLTDGQLQLRAWRSIWISEPQHEDELYVYFWGKEGFDDIQARLRSLQDLSTRIRTLLRRPTTNGSDGSLSSSERLEWHDFIRQEENLQTNNRTELSHQKMSLVRRIGFSLFENAALQDKVGRLKSQVQGLDDYSMRIFRLMRSGDPNSKVSPREVRELAALKHFIDRASMVGSLAFENSPLVKETDAALELTPPDEDEALHMWNELDDHHLVLFIRSVAGPKRTACRFRIIYGLEAQSPRDEILELLRKARLLILDGIPVETDLARGALLAELDPPSSRSRAFRKMLIDGTFTSKEGKSFDFERADLIFGLAHWFIHFWNTPWAVDLCSCNIRQVRLPHSRTCHSLTAGPVALISHSQCRPIELADRKLTLLGKTLAEAALAVPITLDLEDGEVKYIINGVRKTRRGLLADLRHRYGRKTITKAIKYCLDPAHADHKRFLPEDMELFCQNILHP